MNIIWAGREGEKYPLLEVDGVVCLHHGNAVTAVCHAAWNLPGRCWSSYDADRLEAAVKEIRRRIAAHQKVSGEGQPDVA